MKHLIDGVRYNVEIEGEGFPAILLHGFTGDTSTWEPFYSVWGGHSKLIAIDIIGHGESDSPIEVERYRMMSVVDDLFLLMEKLKISQADFIGYSMGGRLALSFAEKYGSKVRKLILESSSPGLKLEEERKGRRESDQKLASFIEEKGIDAFVEYWSNIPLFESQKRLPKEIQLKIRNQRLKNSSIGLANSLRGMGTGVQPPWWGELSHVPNHTLLVTGSLDQKFCRIAQEMKEGLRNCHWICVENAGHAIHVEQPEKFGTIVSEFLANS